MQDCRRRIGSEFFAAQQFLEGAGPDKQWRSLPFLHQPARGPLAMSRLAPR